MKSRMEQLAVGWLLMVLGVMSCTTAAAQDLPQGWPWRGIAMDSFGGHNDAADIAKLAAVKANAVELILSVRHTAQFERISPQAAWTKNLAWADRMLDACRQYGLVGVITFVQVPIDPALGIRQDSPEFWDVPARRGEAVRLAGELAKHFRNRGRELGAYEILNEPLVRRWYRQERPSEWPDLRDAIIKKIRQYDPSRFIVVSPGPGGEASGYKDFASLDQPRIIYGAHFYNPHEYTHQRLPGWKQEGGSYPGKWQRSDLERALAPLVAFKNKYHALVWIGEFSAVRWAPGADLYLADCIDLFDRNGFGWMYFVYNGYHGWNPFFDTQYATDNRSDWQGHYVGDNTPRWALLERAYGRSGR